MSTTREALEAALAANPDDVAAHSAYADLLIEAGDPRGEYIRLQLALEDRNQPADRLRAMEQEAFAVRREHEAEWLGPLAEFVLPQRGPSVGAMVADNVEVTWRRGWIHGLRIGQLETSLVNAMLVARDQTLLLAELTVRATRIFGQQIGELAEWYAATLRKLQFGDPDTVSAIFAHGMSAPYPMPRLEELCLAGIQLAPLDRMFGDPYPNLRDLYVSTADGFPFPVMTLGRNPTLTQLQRIHLDMGPAVEPIPQMPEDTELPPEVLRIFFRSPHLRSLEHLALRLPGFGDAGVDELISSGMIARLKGLDLCRCEITDDGAQELAACPDVAKLEYLHLDNNLLSPVGTEALAAVGVTVSDRQMYGGWDAEV